MGALYMVSFRALPNCFWLLFAFAPLQAIAFPSMWATRVGCFAPTVDRFIMANTPVSAVTKEELSLVGQDLTVSTSSMAHLLVIAAGEFANPSEGGQLFCQGKMVAWNKRATSRSVTLNAPAGVLVTLATAGGYGPVTLYNLTTVEAALTTALKSKPSETSRGVSTNLRGAGIEDLAP